MAVTIEGCLAQVMDNARTLLSVCEPWQTWTGKATAAEAKTRIYLCDLPKPDGSAHSLGELAAQKPYAIIKTFRPTDSRGRSFRAQRQGLGAFKIQYRVELLLVDEVKDEDQDDPAEAELRFLAKVGLVLDAIRDKGGGDTDYLSVLDIEEFDPPTRTDESERETIGDQYSASYVLMAGTL